MEYDYPLLRLKPLNSQNNTINQGLSLSCIKHPNSKIIAVCTYPNCIQNDLICVECSFQYPEHNVSHKNYINLLPKFFENIKMKMQTINIKQIISDSNEEIEKSINDINKLENDINNIYDNMVKNFMQDIQINFEKFFCKMKDDFYGKDLTVLNNLDQNLKQLKLELDNTNLSKVYNALDGNCEINFELLKILLNETTYLDAEKIFHQIKKNLGDIKIQKNLFLANAQNHAHITSYFDKFTNHADNFFKNLYEILDNPNKESIDTKKLNNPEESNRSKPLNEIHNSFNIDNKDAYEDFKLNKLPFASKETIQDIKAERKKSENQQYPPKEEEEKSEKITICDENSKVISDLFKSDEWIHSINILDTLGSKTSISQILINQMANMRFPTVIARFTDETLGNPKLLTLKERLLAFFSRKDFLNDPQANNLYDTVSAKIFSVIPESEFMELKIDYKHLYYGNLVDNKKQGFGIAIYPEVALYIGEYDNDKQNGIGIKILKSGDFYDGEWSQGIYNGKGILSNFSENEIYYGDLWNGIKHGHGFEKKKDGSLYKGDFVYGTREGKGLCIWIDNERYEGDFRNNKMEGIGIYIWSDNACYIGQWKDNMMHGKGLLNDSTGGKYIGDFYKDLKHGYGYYQWNDKWCYRGDWVNGMQQGFGVEGDPNENRTIGYWKEGRLMKRVEQIN